MHCNFSREINQMLLLVIHSFILLGCRLEAVENVNLCRLCERSVSGAENGAERGETSDERRDRRAGVGKKRSELGSRSGTER